MQAKSIYRYARISAFKAREVTRAIQGMPVADALALLRVTPKKAARMVYKTLRSAVANAEMNHNSYEGSLVVLEAVVGEGPTLKRFRPKARGSAGPIRKRTSHIRVIVTDEVEIERREKPARKRKASKANKPFPSLANKVQVEDKAAKAAKASQEEVVKQEVVEAEASKDVEGAASTEEESK